jgi:Lysyl oxidase
MSSRWFIKPTGRTPQRKRAKSRRTFCSRRLILLEDRVTPAALIPDLVVRSDYLSGWSINNLGGNNREIRYSTALTDIGTGPFELHQTNIVRTNPDGSQSVQVNEREYNDVNGNGVYDVNTDTTFNDVFAGWMSYTPALGVMHFNEFAIARLRLRPSDQSVGPTVASGPKTSFCLEDLASYNTSLPGAPASGKYTCTATSEGISIGWSDVYSSGLNGQTINITSVPAGDYWLEVECDYANHIQETNENNNITRIPITITSAQVPPVGMLILSSTPIGAQQTPVDHVDFNFNEAIDPTSFTPAGVTFTGPTGAAIPITNVQQISAIQYRVNFAQQTAIGTYNMVLAPTIKTTDGHFIDQNNNGTGGESADTYTNIFAITAPYIVSTTPAGQTTAPVGSIRMTYDRLMDSSTFTTADVISFKGPGGTDLLGTITGTTPVVAGGQSNAFDVAFAAVSAPGVYTMVIGANVQDPSGHYVDQNQDGTPNTPADQYTAVFTIQIPGVYGPDAFGYTAQSTPYQTIDMTSGTAVSFTNTDDGTNTIPLGTDSFNFYGTSYTGLNQLYVSCNGLLSFGAADGEYQNDDLSTRANPTIAPLWDDWIIGTGNPEVRYLKRDTNSDGINDQLIVEWNQVYHYSSTPNGVTFQAILELNTGARPGKVIFNYPDLICGNTSYDNGASATTGVRSNTTMNSRLLVSQESNTFPLVGSNKAMLISVPSVVSITRADPNPATAGEVEFDVTFSDGVTNVGPSDFAITKSANMKGSFIAYVSTTADPKVWEVSVQSGTGAGTLRLDVMDHDSIISLSGARLGGAGAGNGNFTAGEVYTVQQPPPQVYATVVGDGTSQRSEVNQVQILFNYLVTFAGAPSNAFVLTGPNGPVNVAVDTSTSTPLATTAKLTFSGAGTDPGGSLADGNYSLAVLASQVKADGVPLDGNGDGTGGDNFNLSLYRLFGDINGDRAVAANDFAAFRAAYNAPVNNAAFDFDNDGVVSTNDFVEFRNRFNTSI